VVPSPLQSTIPTFLSNSNERSIAYAAEHGMSYVSVTSSWGEAGIDKHNAFHARFEQIATDHGRSVEGLEYPQTLFCYIAPTDEEAIDIARNAILNRNAYAEAHYESRRKAGNVQAPLSVPEQDGHPVGHEERFQAQLKTNLIGSPGSVVEKLLALRERLPTMNYVLATVGIGAAPIEVDRRSLRLLAEKVMPHFT
jgi:alkanesulfonate monooxygenase SsuD/methylene tetrahydromethanopterin reductase-like flavin-dependent oxidoreductase (luciferase family)